MGLIRLLPTDVGAISSGLENLDILIDPNTAAQHMLLHAQNKGLYRTAVHASSWLPLSTVSSPTRALSLISALRSKLAELDAEGSNFYNKHPGLYEQFSLQLDALESDDLPDCELIYTPFNMDVTERPAEKGKSYVSIICGLNHPFSRRSIHIMSADPSTPPTIDTNVFEHEIDLNIIVDARNLRNVAPLASIIRHEKRGGTWTRDTNGRRAQTWREEYSACWIPRLVDWLVKIDTAGSCSMLPRNKGSAIDATLKVYGTTNVHVGGISMPLHIAAHAQAAAYGIAEKLADILKSDEA